MVLVAGVLLITPGVLTDLTGFVLVFPPTRTRLAPIIKSAVLARLAGSNTSVRFGSRDVPPPPRREEGHPPPFDHPTA